MRREEQDPESTPPWPEAGELCLPEFGFELRCSSGSTVVLFPQALLGALSRPVIALPRHGGQNTVGFTLSPAVELILVATAGRGTADVICLAALP